MDIIAFTGCKMVGKSTVAKELLRISKKKTKIISFADPIRSMLVTMGIEESFLKDQSLKEKNINQLEKTPRQLMQSLGSDWGRDMVSPNIWIWAINKSVVKEEKNGTDLIIIDDLRFENEADWVLSRGGRVVKLKRNNYDYGNDSHQSECPICENKVSITLDSSDTNKAALACFTFDTLLNG